MEESLSFLCKIKKEFGAREGDIRMYSPLSLAFIGDAVFEIVIRSIVVAKSHRSPHSLHNTKSKIVKAGTQADLADALEASFTDEELAVYKRGRNAKSHTSAKNASVVEYRKATGFEAVMGYLYLMDEEDRMLALIKEGLEKININI